MAREARRQGSMPAGKKARRKGGNETRRQRGTLFGGMEATRHSRRQDGKQAGKAASKEARRQGSKEAGRQRGSEKTRQGGNLFGGKVARSQPRNLQRRQVSQKQRSKEAIEEARRQARRQRSKQAGKETMRARRSTQQQRQSPGGEAQGYTHCARVARAGPRPDLKRKHAKHDGLPIGGGPRYAMRMRTLRREP